jgi:hypothetical protein
MKPCQAAQPTSTTTALRMPIDGRAIVVLASQQNLRHQRSVRLGQSCGADALYRRMARRRADGFHCICPCFKLSKQNLGGVVVRGGRIEVREVLEIVEQRERKLLADMGDL